MTVTPHVFRIIRSAPDMEGIAEWLEYLGVEEFPIPSDEEKVNIGAELVRLCAKRCYMSFELGHNINITRIRTDLAEFITNILEVGHGCYDDQTEVLTQDGWKRWPDVTLNDWFATLNNQGEVQYSQSTRLIKYKHEGRMYQVEGQVDLLVTPDHKMLVCPVTTLEGRKKLWNGYNLVAATELDTMSVAYLKSAPYRHTFSDTRLYALGQLYGFALGDGYVGGGGD